MKHVNLFDRIQKLLDEANREGDDACVDACVNALAGTEHDMRAVLVIYGRL